MDIPFKFSVTLFTPMHIQMLHCSRLCNIAVDYYEKLEKDNRERIFTLFCILNVPQMYASILICPPSQSRRILSKKLISTPKNLFNKKDTFVCVYAHVRLPSSHEF